MLPRWRPFKVTAALNELGCPGRRASLGRVGEVPPELRARLENWRRDGGLVASAEVIETAVVFGDFAEAKSAATSLLRPGWSGATRLVLQAAALALDAGGYSELVANKELVAGALKVDASLRSYLAKSPRDALLWSDLALLQTNRGHLEGARRSILTALGLAPTNRHVLRAACRFYFHLGDPDRAYTLIKNAPNCMSDPWLMAAEIALAGKAGKKPRAYKVGSGLLDSGAHLPRQISELAASLASLHLADGNHKRAKRIFVDSLKDPTGNSLAQAEWASNIVGDQLLGEGQLSRAYDAAEANAIHRFEGGDFEGAFESSIEWQKQEPHSSRACLIAAGAANALGNFLEATQMACMAFKRNSRSPMILNTLIYSCASNNDIIGARDYVRRISVLTLDPRDTAVLEANRGLIAFRCGSQGVGLEHYRSSIAMFRRMSDRSGERLARIFLARESAIAGVGDAASLLEEAISCHPSHSSPLHAVAVASVINALRRHES